MKKLVLRKKKNGEPAVASRINCFGSCSTILFNGIGNKEVDEKKDNISLDVASQVSTKSDAPPEVKPVWPSWLFSIASDALEGWTPRSSNGYEIIHEVHDDLFKARDIMTDKIVALKKIKIHSWEPEVVEGIAQEIVVLRRMESHPDVMKLDGLALIHDEQLSMYLVFEERLPISDERGGQKKSKSLKLFYTKQDFVFWV